MGRTQRKRRRKTKIVTTTSLDHEPIIVTLKQWMTENNWQNKNNLRLSYFSETERGITSNKKLDIGDTLIEIPYKLMITLTTLESLISNNMITTYNELQMQDLLSIFLIIERHKGVLSKWKHYIDSLPNKLPPLPWLCSSSEIAVLPRDLQEIVLNRRKTFELSWERSKESINSRWKCECCQTLGHRVITLNSFTWAYVMVNTRTVYVDPNIVRELSCNSTYKWSDIISDEPCMALCPFLDMFNHSNLAKNQANLIKIHGTWTYKLSTLSATKKHEEIFISYGSHDNIKLLCEYGFFIPDHTLDIIHYEMSEVLNASNIHLSKRQYKYIKMRTFDESLYIDYNGPSFNLKAILFIMLNPHLPNWCVHIFGNYAEKDFLQIQDLMKQLLVWKTSVLMNELNCLKIREGDRTEQLENIFNYLNYLVTVLNEMKDHASDEM